MRPDDGRARQKELVTAQRAARKTMRALRVQLRMYLLSNYGADAASMFEDFGYPAPKKAKVTVATKAEAIAKSATTRASRGTKGKTEPQAAPAATTK